MRDGEFEAFWVNSSQNELIKKSLEHKESLLESSANAAVKQAISKKYWLGLSDNQVKTTVGNLAFHARKFAVKVEII